MEVSELFPVTKKKTVLIIGMLLAFAVAAAAVGLHVFRQLQNLEAYRQTIEAYARRALGRDLQYESARLSFRFGPALTFTGVKIAEKSGPEPFASAVEIAVRIAVLPYILEKRLVVREIRLEEPRMRIVRDREGRWNIADLFTATEAPEVDVGGITAAGGEITLVDTTIKEGVLVIKAIDFHLERWERGATVAFSLAGTLAGKSGDGRLSLAGKVRLAKKTEDILDSSLIRTKLRTEQLDLAGPWPWYRRWTPFQKLGGLLTAELVLNGPGHDFTASGSLEITDPELAYPPVFPETIKAARLRLTCDVHRTPGAVVMSRAETALDGLKVQGKMILKDLLSPDPFVEATASVADFDLERHGNLIPYGIIPASTGDFIRKYVRAGVFHVETGALKGRLSELKTWGAFNRASVLLVRAKVTKGRLDFGGQTPAFQGITGELTLTEREFSLQGMEGNFGAAPFTLTGKIDNYTLPAPVTYPFTAVIRPTTKELAWLFGNKALRTTSFAGQTTLNLTGRGPAAAYEVRGEWELGSASYSYGEWFAKPAGRANSVHFTVKIDGQGMDITPCLFSLPPLEIEASAFYPFAASTRSVRFTAQSNRVTLPELKALSPVLTRYEAAGFAQGKIRFNTKSGKSAGGLWQGSLSLQEAAFKPSARLHRLQDLTGIIQWEGDTLTTSRLAGRYGKTPFSLAGTRKESPQPVYQGSLAIPALQMEDLGAGKHLAGVPIRDLLAHVTYKRDVLSFADLSFRLREGRAAAAGETRFSTGAGPARHHYRFRFEGMPVADLFKEVDKDRLITGTTSGQGELTVTSGNDEELLKSLAGNLRLQVETGTINKFPVLAKIFSLLNVSQILRLRLPDMTAEGMTFRRITTTMAIKNGVASTKDFYLDSDAMNIVGMGKTDLVRRTIDATVGLQPLQTVDKVVSRIPIAGWILTDDDRRLLTVYFEAKGPLDNPTVQTIPLRGLSEETFNMFKRVLKLPKKLITDTGEVRH